MLYSILVFLLVLVSIMLIGIILVQSGQGDMGAAMGGNTMNQAFGSEGADKLLVRITTVLATIFMVLAIGIQIVPEGTGDNKKQFEGDGTEKVSEENSVQPDSNAVDSTIIP